MMNAPENGIIKYINTGTTRSITSNMSDSAENMSENPKDNRPSKIHPP
jgi:hypothetical protein